MESRFSFMKIKKKKKRNDNNFQFALHANIFTDEFSGKTFFVLPRSINLQRIGHAAGTKFT